MLKIKMSTTTTIDFLETLSGATLFIPSIVALYKQPFFVGFILFAAAGISTAYHAYDEQRYITEDLILATSTSILLAILLIAIGQKYGLKSYRFYVPLLLSVIAFSIFFGGGSDADLMNNVRSERLEVLHSFWHIMSSAAAVSIVVQDIPYGDIMKPLGDLSFKSKSA